MNNAPDQAFARIFNLSDSIRYVAIRQDGVLESREAAKLENASSAESDKYEETFVNPTLLFLAQQRGNIDCGGASFIIVGYGNFRQLIIAIHNGHVSVAFELGSNPLDYVDAVGSVFDDDGTRVAAA
jgi:hypothetical protein